MKYLIVNADDFGWSDAVNRAIVDCHRQGIVTSVSLVVNGYGFSNAVAYLGQLSSLGVGLHLNIFRFRPLLPAEKVKTLVDKNGYFLGNLGLFGVRFFLNKINLSEVKEEFRFQIEKAIAAGISPTHLDSEQHLHLLPFFFKIVSDLAEEYNIKIIRTIKEKQTIDAFFRVFILRQLSIIDGKYLKNNIVDNTVGLGHSINSQSDLKKIINNLPDGITELIVHPGSPNNKNIKINDRRRKKREKEWQILSNPTARNLINDEKIILTNFKKIIE